MKYILSLVLSILLMYSCAKSGKNYYDSSGYNYEEDAHEGMGLDNDGNLINENGEIVNYCGYDDGAYSATVDYTNPDTDYSQTYDLEVEISNCEIVSINFPKGGNISCAAYIDDGEADVEEDGKYYHIYLE